MKELSSSQDQRDLILLCCARRIRDDDKDHNKVTQYLAMIAHVLAAAFCY